MRRVDTKIKAVFGMLLAGFMLAMGPAAHADENLIPEANAVKASFKKTDPGMESLLEHAPGYVIFPGVGKAGLGIGGAHGSGIVYEKGKPVGSAKLNQVSVGAQIGAQEYVEVIVFQTAAALAKFQSGNFAFSGTVSAVALKSGAAANARFDNGVAVFTATKTGLMLEASVGGQKFSYQPFPR
jgi:lipid-binding SYLF domain-containing protein